MNNIVKTLFNTRASLSNLSAPVILVVLLVAFLVITLIAGGYPAAILSKLGTLKALKGKLEISGKNRVRNVLMVVQFSIAILLISGTLVLWSQLDYMRNKDLGFDSDFNEVTIFYKNDKKEKLFAKNKSLISEEIIERINNQLN